MLLEGEASIIYKLHNLFDHSRLPTTSAVKPTFLATLAQFFILIVEPRKVDPAMESVATKNFSFSLLLPESD